MVANETAFITNIKEPWYAVMNPDLKLGFALRWDLSVFPGLWFWQNYPIPDHPWFGKAYCVALEPCPGHLTACEQLRRGTVKKLQGNASLETQLTATVFAGIEKMKIVNSNGTVVPSQVISGNCYNDVYPKRSRCAGLYRTGECPRSWDLENRIV